MGKYVNAHLILFSRQNLGRFWRRKKKWPTQVPRFIDGPLKPREWEELAWAHTASKGRAGARTQVCWLPTLFPLGPATALPCWGATVGIKAALRLWLCLGSVEKWDFERGWGSTQWPQPPSPGLLGLRQGVPSQRPWYQKGLWRFLFDFILFSSQWASADIKYMMIFKETNQNLQEKCKPPESAVLWRKCNGFMIF